MKKDQLKLDLTIEQGLACKVGSYLKYDKKTKEFYKCPWNDTLLFICYLLLGRKDPIEFFVWLSTESGDYNEKEVRSLLDNLKKKKES